MTIGSEIARLKLSLRMALSKHSDQGATPITSTMIVRMRIVGIASLFRPINHVYNPHSILLISKVNLKNMVKNQQTNYVKFKSICLVN